MTKSHTTHTGSAFLELSFIFGSTGRGDEVLQEVGVENHQRSTMTPGLGCSLSRQERDAIWAALPEWLQEKLVAQANEDMSEDEADCDVASDEARMPRSA